MAGKYICTTQSESERAVKYYTDGSSWNRNGMVVIEMALFVEICKP